MWGLTRPEPPRVARFEMTLDDMKLLRGPAGGVSVALSPDGEHLVYVTGAGNPLGPAGGEQLRVRSLSQLGSTFLASTRVYSPFFSPDSAEVGFAQAGLNPHLLQRVSVGGGPISVITRIPPPGNSMAGASWSADGTVVFATTGPASGLWRVAASGGESERLTAPNTRQGDVALGTLRVEHTWPAVLPDGDAVLFTISRLVADLGPPGMQGEESQIAVLSLDTGEQKVLVEGGSYPRYSPTGHLLYGAEGALWAVGFDLTRFETVGNPVSGTGRRGDQGQPRRDGY